MQVALKIIIGLIFAIALFYGLGGGNPQICFEALDCS